MKTTATLLFLVVATLSYGQADTDALLNLSERSSKTAK